MSALDRAFTHYNHKYFGGKLPECKIIFSKSIGDLCGEFDPEGPTIRINPAFRRFDAVWKSTLCHEMVHLKLEEDPQCRDAAAHGKDFQREMRRLVRLGAFDSIW